MTGDNPTTAPVVADAVAGLDGVHAELKPDDKAHIAVELKASGAKVAMAGDGILMSPMVAGAAMALSSLTVVMNALRLNRVTL